MPTIKDWLNRSTHSLKSINISSARLDCLILLESTLNKDRAWILTNQDRQLSDDELKKSDKFLGRRQNHEPIAYITGNAAFYGLNLKVNPDVLIPRPETEDLVTLAASLVGDKARVLEIGTGSGAISIALKNLRPDLQISATDISKPALKIAKINAAQYSFDDIKFFQANLMDDINGSYDLVMANLPYVSTEDKVSAGTIYEPKQALYSPDNGLFHYKRMFAQLSKKSTLKRGGLVIIELNPWQRNSLVSYAESHGFKQSIVEANSNYILVLEN